jgi:hypothetical protein
MTPFREILQRLHDRDVPFVIIGGVAAALLGSSMATYDIDVCAPLDHAISIKIVEALEGTNPRFAMRPDLPVVTPDNHNLRLVKNLYLRTDLGRLDVLGFVDGVGDYEAAVRQSVAFDFGGNLTCQVLELDALIASKRAAGRDKDIVGVQHLEAIKREKKQQPDLFDKPPTN